MREVTLDSLGLCEHCNALFSLQDMPADSMSARWHCPHCEKEVSYLSFGYDCGTRGA